MSARKAWDRACKKQSPTKKILMSPIKHVCYHSILESIIDDRIAETHLWALMTTEEFYYQESCSLVYHNFSLPNGSLMKLLNDTRIRIDWSQRLEEFEVIGRGCFGEVYRGLDTETGKYLALKRIVQKDAANAEVESFISNILLEKSTLYEINKCPFFVRLIGSFQESTKKAYWFVLEYCICDLSKIVQKYPSYNDNDSLWDDYMSDNALYIVDGYLSDVYRINYTDIIFIYLFEMLCALNYLAKRHIRHADLKHDNILISTTGHIKFGDFGLAFRDNWFYRHSLTIIAASEQDKQGVDELDAECQYKGNTMHYDPEMTIIRKITENKQFGLMLDDHYAENNFYQELSEFDQEFISDLYAVGLITTELLFGGLYLKRNPKTHPRNQYPFWSIDIAYDETISTDFIDKRFVDQAEDDEEVKSVMSFLSSIFLPRPIRAKGYLSKIKVFVGSQLKVEKYINIRKVEKILYYSSKSITHLNVLNKRFPSYFINQLTLLTETMSCEPQSKKEKQNRYTFNLPGFGFTDTKYVQ